MKVKDPVNSDFDNQDYFDDLEKLTFYECQNETVYGISTFCSLNPDGRYRNEECEGYLLGKLARIVQKQRKVAL